LRAGEELQDLLNGLHVELRTARVENTREISLAICLRQTTGKLQTAAISGASDDRVEATQTQTFAALTGHEISAQLRAAHTRDTGGAAKTGRGCCAARADTGKPRCTAAREPTSTRSDTATETPDRTDSPTRGKAAEPTQTAGRSKATEPAKTADRSKTTEPGKRAEARKAAECSNAAAGRGAGTRPGPGKRAANARMPA
jgi:hypothetical protein